MSAPHKESITEYLKTQVGDDADMIEMLYEEYLSTLEEKMTALEPLMTQPLDCAKVFPTAHALKGDTAVVGDTRTSEIAAAFSDSIKGGDAAGGWKYYEQLKAVTAEVFAERG